MKDHSLGSLVALALFMVVALGVSKLRGAEFAATGPAT